MSTTIITFPPSPFSLALAPGHMNASNATASTSASMRNGTSSRQRVAPNHLSGAKHNTNAPSTRDENVYIDSTIDMLDRPDINTSANINAVAGPSKPISRVIGTGTTPRGIRIRTVLSGVQPNTPRSTRPEGSPTGADKADGDQKTLPLLRIRAGKNPTVTTVPRPASSPDVFAPEPVDGPTRLHSPPKLSLLGKRPREVAASVMADPPRAVLHPSATVNVQAPVLAPIRQSVAPASTLPPPTTSTSAVLPRALAGRTIPTKRTSMPPPRPSQSLDVFMAECSRTGTPFNASRTLADGQPPAKRLREATAGTPRPSASMPVPQIRPTLTVNELPPPRARGREDGARDRENADPGHDDRRARHADAELVVQQHKVEEEKWRSKWIRAFPSLRFYFENGDDATSRLMKARAIKMGAVVDQFFSQKITHVIVKGTGSPRKVKPLAPSKMLNQSPANPFDDNTGTTDLATKALNLNIKVWPSTKLYDMLDRICPAQPIVKQTKESLRTLLEDEKIHGTKERDLTAPRKDFYYFKPGSKFVLVEDATGRHRPIMAKEYFSQSGADTKDALEWPILHQSFMRISGHNQTNIPTKKLRDRAWALYVERKAFEGERPPCELRRATSMRNIPGTPKLPQAQPYANASGNSVVITSNIASTSCANPSPFGAHLGIPGLGLGASKDRALAQMSKRVQVLKGNARLAAFRRPQTQPDDIFAVPQRRASTGMPPQQKQFMTQQQVVNMLRQAREARHEEVAPEIRAANRAKVDKNAHCKDQDSSAGYCENCRVRFRNLAMHLVSNKHRKFALNDRNFRSLDDYLSNLERPVNPLCNDSQYRPCHVRHYWDADCARCKHDAEIDEEYMEDFFWNHCRHPFEMDSDEWEESEEESGESGEEEDDDEEDEEDEDEDEDEEYE